MDEQFSVYSYLSLPPLSERFYESRSIVFFSSKTQPFHKTRLDAATEADLRNNQTCFNTKNIFSLASHGNFNMSEKQKSRQNVRYTPKINIQNHQIVYTLFLFSIFKQTRLYHGLRYQGS